MLQFESECDIIIVEVQQCLVSVCYTSYCAAFFHRFFEENKPFEYFDITDRIILGKY